VRAAALLALAFAATTAGSAIAQPDQAPERIPLTFASPSVSSTIFRSRVHLLKNRLFDIAHLRDLGTRVEAGPTELGDRVLRFDSSLLLKIDGGQVLQLVDEPRLTSEAGPIIHTFEAWLPGPRFYVVSVTCNECALTYLIDARDGKVADVTLPPMMSPSGQLGVVWTQDFMGGIFSGPPFLVDFRSHPPVARTAPGYPNCEKRAWPTNLRLSPVWTDETHIRFEGGTPMHDDDPNARQVLKIVDGKLEWDC
jgi:hypothetical protein